MFLHYENVETFFKWFECFRNKLIEWNHNDVGCRSTGRKHKERKAATVLDANAASQRSQGDERWWRSSSAREGHCTLWHLLWRKKVPGHGFTFSIFQTNTAQSVWCFQPRGGVVLNMFRVSSPEQPEVDFNKLINESRCCRSDGSFIKT